MDLLPFHKRQTSAVEIVGDDLKVTVVGVHVKQRVVRESIAVSVNRDVSGDSSEARSPHQLRESRAVQRLQKRFIAELSDALIQSFREQ